MHSKLVINIIIIVIITHLQFPNNIIILLYYTLRIPEYTWLIYNGVSVQTRTWCIGAYNIYNIPIWLYNIIYHVFVHNTYVYNITMYYIIKTAMFYER